MIRHTRAGESQHQRALVLGPGAITEGLDRNEFEVWYQPQLDLSSGGLARFEALVRWRHPQLGILLPGEFIALAEASAEMDRLGDFVLLEAIRQVAVWRSLAPDSDIGVAVNLTAAQAVDPHITRKVSAALADADVPARFLSLEVPEASLMDQAVERVVANLKDEGVAISVDDFGAGFSSLPRLRRLRVDYVKLSRRLVSGLGRDADDTLVVEAVVQMAHTLGMQAVAEGVETLDQLGRLSDLGCDFAQGFYWSKAMLSEDARQMVTRALVQLTA